MITAARSSVDVIQSQLKCVDAVYILFFLAGVNEEKLPFLETVRE